MRNRLLISFYGDDFTGSTDVMETLTMGGIPCALFMDTPTLDAVERFRLKGNHDADARLRAYGVAGIARSLSPQTMSEHLPPIFEAMARVPADYFLYKICSTLDSSPSIGNIGMATDLAARYFPSSIIPLVVGAPFLNRFVVFGQLFARLDGITYRLDRHPVMSRHPVTPMDESDIRLHLEKQTDRHVHPIDLFAIDAAEDPWLKAAVPPDFAPYWLFDTLTQAHLERIGGWLYHHWPGYTQLLVGASGVTAGLAAHLGKQNGTAQPPCVGTDWVSGVVVSGSCSSVTARQIAHMQGLGAVGVRVDAKAMHEDSDAEITRAQEVSSRVLADKRIPVLYTALGPDDPSINLARGRSGGRDDAMLSRALARLTQTIVRSHPRLRVVIAGGDTSGYVMQCLGIYALEMLRSVAPGAPLCIAHSDQTLYDGMEIALKGGQNGKDDYFEAVFRK